MYITLLTNPSTRLTEPTKTR